MSDEDHFGPVDWTVRHALLSGGADRCDAAARDVCLRERLGAWDSWSFTRDGEFVIRGRFGSWTGPFPFGSEV